ncbi:MAG: amidohydrolase/deacetylase family metallohydrolase [Betaproteobacteria bacterium]
MQYDLLLRGGRVIDPAQNIDGLFDVAIQDGKIAAVAASIVPSSAKEVVNVAGKLVLPGLIDTHGHVFQHVTGRFGLDADLAGVHSGVTTLIDQGGPSCMTLPAFREYVVKAKKSRVVAFISAYLVGGMEGHYYASLYKPDCLDVDATVAAAKANLDIVKGFKVHAEIGGMTRWGIEDMRMAAEMGRQTGLPLYIHFGQMWGLPSGVPSIDPDTILPEVVKLLKPGDILAHPFSKHPGSFVDRHGKVHPVAKEAIAKGIKVDVGHGSHFSFKMAQVALDAGILPDTLGADMHGYNTVVPKPAGTPEQHSDQDHMFFGAARFSLVSAMTAMLACGLKLEQVIPMVTTNAAKMAGMAGTIGTLVPGVCADVSVLNDDRGRWVLEDNEKTQVVTDRMLTPAFCLRAGERFDSDASILPVAQAA